MIPIPVLPDQFGAIGGLRRGACPQPSRSLGECFGIRTKGLLEDRAMLCFRRSPKPGGPLFQCLYKAVVEASDDELAHCIPCNAIV